MADRDKLAELLAGYYGVDPVYYGVDAYGIADHFLANGVTFQTWIPVSERLPDTFGTFIIAVRIPTRKRTYSDSANFDPFAKKMDTIFILGKRHECNSLDAVTGTAGGGLTMAKPKIYGIRKPIPNDKKKGKKAPWEK